MYYLGYVEILVNFYNLVIYYYIFVYILVLDGCLGWGGNSFVCGCLGF